MPRSHPRERRDSERRDGPRREGVHQGVRERHLRSSVAELLAAERMDDGAAAEQALYGLFRHLPRPAPSADFAARVLHRAGLAPATVSADVSADLARPVRRWVMAALVFTGLAIAVALPPAQLLALRIDWVGAFAGSVGAIFGWIGAWVVGLFTAVDDVLLLGRAASAVGRAFRLVVASPQVLAALTLLFTVTALLLRALAELVHTPRKAHASF